MKPAEHVLQSAKETVDRGWLEGRAVTYGEHVQALVDNVVLLAEAVGHCHRCKQGCGHPAVMAHATQDLLEGMVETVAWAASGSEGCAVALQEGLERADQRKKREPSCE